MIEPFHVAVAATPLAVYLLLHGWIRSLGRPFVVSGGRDLATLAIAMGGLMMVGPMELFFPRSASALLGGRVWLVLLIFYLLCITLVVLSCRPRLIVYGLGPEQLQEQLVPVFSEIDPSAFWEGSIFHSQLLRGAAVVESAGGPMLSQLILVHSQPDATGWSGLERALVQRMTTVRVDQRRDAVWYYLAASLLLASAAIGLLRDPQGTAEAMRELLRWQ
jgi:uncharacterized membrane protein